MSHSRNKITHTPPPQQRPQSYRPEVNRGRGPQVYQGEHSGQDFNRNMEYSRGSRDESQSMQGGDNYDYGEQDWYGAQRGYRQMNYPQSEQESDYSYGGEYIQDDSEFRPGQNRGYDWNPSYRGNGMSTGRESQGRIGSSGRSGWQDDRWATRGSQGGSYSQQRDRSAESYGQSGSSMGRQSYAGKGPQGYRRSDERITEDINEQLTQDHMVDATGISVETQNGDVTLKGTVTDRQSKRRAEEIAESCSGVKDVQNQLRIKQEDSGDANSGSEREKQEGKRSRPN